VSAVFLPAIVTHKGAAADAGHYIGFVKKSVFHASTAGSNGLTSEESDEDWYKFDDDKVSVFPKEKLNTLDGGGEPCPYFPFSLEQAWLTVCW
jgi:ubiquitin carboxyl-terminal hydrolase 14